jgi:ATP-dependent Clp protease protease subunit
MNNSFNDFKKFAQSMGVSGTSVDKYFDNIINPYIVEERVGNPLQIDIFSKLFTDRILFLGCEIDSHVANVITSQLLYLESINPKKEINLYINSPGGVIYDGLAIYDVMQYISSPIHTTCMGLAASMASILLCGGENGHRTALKHSRVMIHQPLGGLRAGTQASDFEIANKEIQELKTDLYAIMSQHTGKSIEEITLAADRDRWLRPNEAKEFGLIDNIVEKKTLVG